MMIRKAINTDEDSVLQMYGKLYDTLRSFGMPFELDTGQMRHILSVQMQSKMYNILVAEEDGENIGFISTSISKIDRKLKGGMIGLINDVYVRPEARKRGTASALLAEAEAWFRTSGVHSVQCDIIAGNEPALGFWRSHGYTDMSISAYKCL